MAMDGRSFFNVGTSPASQRENEMNAKATGLYGSGSFAESCLWLHALGSGFSTTRIGQENERNNAAFDHGCDSDGDRTDFFLRTGLGDPERRGTTV